MDSTGTSFIAFCMLALLFFRPNEARNACRYNYGCYICQVDVKNDENCRVYRYCFSRQNGHDKPQCLEYNRNTQQDGCGVRPALNIVGGSQSVEGEWPWQVSLQNKDSIHICGGVVIGQNWVLTAAHCVFRSRATDLKAVFGEYDLYRRSGNEQYGSIYRTFVHPYFRSGGNYPYDVALAQLYSPIKYTDYIRPICLPSVADSFGPYGCSISGWGETRGTGDNRRLRDLNVTLLDTNTCSKSWYGNIRTNLHICVNYGLKGACSGDSGGPLSCLRKSDGRFVVAGVTSWGDRSCKRYGFPSIYTNIKTFVPWIKETIRLNSRR